MRNVRESYGDTYALSLVILASGQPTANVEKTLKLKWTRARRAGVSERSLKMLERRTERAMAPGLKKLYGVDVRGQTELF